MVNWYVERIESEGARVPKAMYPTPGSERFSMTDQTGGRGIFSESGRCWAGIGGKIVEVFADYTTRAIGDIVQDGRPVRFTTNGDGGNQLFISAGNEGYIFDLVTGVFSNPVHNVRFVGMVDEFFIGLDTLTSTMKVSASLDGLTWDPLQIQQRSDASDPWRSMLILEPEIWTFGEKTTGVWYDKGTAPFPFAPRTGLIIQQGIAAPDSAAVHEGQPTWLGTNRDGGYAVYSAQGYTPVRISTEAVETAMEGYPRVDDAEGFTYRQQGHPFYVLNFPTANATWVYSAKTGYWHERGTWNAPHNRYDAWHAQSHAQAFGKHLVVDRTSGDISRIGTDLGLDVGGAPLRRLRQGPGLRQEGGRIYLSNFQLDMQTGLGKPIGQGADPMVMFQNSWNGGETWGNERWVSAGRMGRYGQRVLWPEIGSGVHFVPRIVVTDPIPWRVMGAEYNVPYGV